MAARERMQLDRIAGGAGARLDQLAACGKLANQLEADASVGSGDDVPHAAPGRARSWGLRGLTHAAYLACGYLLGAGAGVAAAGVAGAGVAGAVGAGTMTSVVPTMLKSTRRFAARPFEVLLSAIGYASP